MATTSRNDRLPVPYDAAETPAQRLIRWTEANANAAMAGAFGVGLLIGLIARR